MEEKKGDGISRAIELSLLKKSEDEQTHFSDEIEKILKFVSDVQSISSEEVPDKNRKVNVFRKDKVTVEAGVYQEKMLAQAPNKFKKWFLSKKIL